jgi:cell division protein FtsN
MKMQRSRPHGTARRQRQRGNFVIGMIIGLLIGLALALGVALYIAKVPVPFVNKVPQRTAEQDAAEVEKNKNWDPNSSLYSKTPARPATVASGTVTEAPTVAAPGATAVPDGVAKKDPRDPAAILGDKPPADPAVLSTKPGNSALSYFVQAGAYGKVEDAEQQRAKLGMMGLQAKVTEREQSGRTVYRARIGPFDKREDAGAAKEKLEGAGVESALVSVQK